MLTTYDSKGVYIRRIETSHGVIVISIMAAAKIAKDAADIAHALNATQAMRDEVLT